MFPFADYNYQKDLQIPVSNAQYLRYLSFPNFVLPVLCMTCQDRMDLHKVNCFHYDMFI